MQQLNPCLQGCIRREEGEGGGSGTQKYVYQKCPKSIFPFANCIFPHHEIRVQAGGGSRLASPPSSSSRCQPF